MSTTHASLGMTLLGLLDRLAAIDAKLRQRAELGRLDARTLRDVGLSRAEIDAEIRRLDLGRRGAFDPERQRRWQAGCQPAARCQVKPKAGRPIS